MMTEIVHFVFVVLVFALLCVATIGVVRDWWRSGIDGIEMKGLPELAALWLILAAIVSWGPPT